MVAISQIQVLVFSSLEVYVLQTLINIGMLFLGTFIHFPTSSSIFLSAEEEEYLKSCENLIASPTFKARIISTFQ